MDFIAIRHWIQYIIEHDESRANWFNREGSMLIVTPSEFLSSPRDWLAPVWRLANYAWSAICQRCTHSNLDRHSPILQSHQLHSE
jgi:hypothetical protein